MKKYLLLFILPALLILQSCGLAPLSNDYTARSLGKANWGINGGGSLMTAGGGATGGGYLRLNRGITDNLDIGGLAEVNAMFLSAGITAKYALINSPQGLSMAIDSSIGAIGAGTTGFYIYGGPIISYKANWLEPYLVIRYNYVHYNKTKVFENDDLFTTIPAFGFSYIYYTLGNTFWLTNKFGITPSVNTIQFLQGGNNGGFPFIANLGLVYRFVTTHSIF